MSFKQVSFYKMLSPVLLDEQALENALLEKKAHKPHATQSRSIGWVSPLGQSEPMVIYLNNLLWMQVRIDQKLLPAGVIKEELSERLLEAESSQGFPVTGKQKRQMRDDITLELLPKAFVQSKWVNVVVDPKAQKLLLDTTSAAVRDTIVDLLRQTVGSLPLNHFHEQRQETSVVLKSWVLGQNVPDFMVIQSDCTLVHPENAQAKVRVVQHELESPLIQSHLESGMLVSQLALKYNNQIQFSLNDCLDISKIKLVDMDAEEVSDLELKAKKMAEFSLQVPMVFELISAFDMWFDLEQEPVDA
ncbi:recombination-associated protein RdgC [Gammaproteobacteria bacterium]|nr:recombination-associated protein RdgC [Gammaproteobacteria bacterium]